MSAILISTAVGPGASGRETTQPNLGTKIPESVQSKQECNAGIVAQDHLDSQAIVLP
jgi:hypothetical protein